MAQLLVSWPKKPRLSFEFDANLERKRICERFEEASEIVCQLWRQQCSWFQCFKTSFLCSVNVVGYNLTCTRYFRYIWDTFVVLRLSIGIQVWRSCDWELLVMLGPLLGSICIFVIFMGFIWLEIVGGDFPFASVGLLFWYSHFPLGFAMHMLCITHISLSACVY